MPAPHPALILATLVVTLVGCDGQGGRDGAQPTKALAENVANACRDVDASQMPDPGAPTPREGYTTVAARDSLLRRIEAGEQRWQSARPAEYRMTVVASCFCRDGGQPLILRVRADSVLDARDTTGQPAWPDDWRTALHVAGLFKEARQFACDSTRTTRLTLDPTLGYPKLLWTASRLEVSDSEREYRVTSFARDAAAR